jgi:hypothetical protein
MNFSNSKKKIQTCIKILTLPNEENPLLELKKSQIFASELSDDFFLEF